MKYKLDEEVVVEQFFTSLKALFQAENNEEFLSLHIRSFLED
jgi:hypothetical protein